MVARFVPTLGGIALVALLAGCGNTPPSNSGTFNPSGSTDNTTPSVPSSTPVEAVPSAMSASQLRDSVLGRYRAYQKAYETAYEKNDASGLSAVATEPLLTKIIKDIEQTQAHGDIWRFHNVLNPRIQGRSEDSSVVLVLDCVRTIGAYRFSAKTGKNLGAYRGGAHAYQAVMKYVDGTWKISNATQGQKC